MRWGNVSVKKGTDLLTTGEATAAGAATPRDLAQSPSSVGNDLLDRGVGYTDTLAQNHTLAPQFFQTLPVGAPILHLQCLSGESNAPVLQIDARVRKRADLLVVSDHHYRMSILVQTPE